MPFFFSASELTGLSRASPVPKQLASNRGINGTRGKLGLNGSWLYNYIASSFTKDPQTTPWQPAQAKLSSVGEETLSHSKSAFVFYSKDQVNQQS